MSLACRGVALPSWKTSGSQRIASRGLHAASRRAAGSKLGVVTAQLVQDTQRVLVKLQRPLGMVLASRPGGAGIYVESLVPKGNAEKSGTVKKDDFLVTVGAPGSKATDVSGASFDKVMDIIGTIEGNFVELVFERQVMSMAEAGSGQTWNGNEGKDSQVAGYWDQKRKEKESGGRKVLRRSGGLVPKEVEVSKSAVIGAQKGSAADRPCQGSFGTVFFGKWKGQEVVLKRPNERVLGAEELMEAEMMINELVLRDAPGSCAAYIGTCEVGQAEEGPLYEGRLNEGLWLVWKYEGRSTFSDLLAKKEPALGSVAAALGLAADTPGSEVAAEVLRQVLVSLAALHKMGVVHRDVKPMNLIANEAEGLLRLIDLGAAASCLNAKYRIGYAKGEGPCDPLFCSERFLLPEDAPEPDESNLQALWETYRPDRFDMFSVGMILMQMALPSLRGEKALSTFSAELNECGSDVARWRQQYGKNWKADQSEVLSAGDEAGWELATMLLAPRAKRPSAAEALQHKFVAGAPGPAKKAGGGAQGAKKEEAAPAKKKVGWLPF